MPACFNTDKFRTYSLIGLFAVCCTLVLAIFGATHNGAVLSWTQFWTRTPGAGTMTYSLGFSTITECWISDTDSSANRCLSQSLSEYDRAINGVCHRGGIGVIVSYTLTIISAIIATVLLVTGKEGGHRWFNNANIVSIVTLLTLGLSIIPTGLWYSTCQSTLVGATVSYSNDPERRRFPIEELEGGAGIGLSATVIAVTTLASAISLWRSVADRYADRSAIAHNNEALIGSTVSSSDKFVVSKAHSWSSPQPAGSFTVTIASV